MDPISVPASFWQWKLLFKTKNCLYTVYMPMIVHVSPSVLWELWGLALHAPGFSPCGTHESGGNPHGATARLGSDFGTTWAAKRKET